MKPSFEHAVVALDLSEASEIIVECLPYLEKFGTRKITLVTVVPIPYTNRRTEFDTEKQRKKLEDFQKELEEYGFEVDIDIRSGVHFYPPTEIISSAEENSADFIVIANRGYNKVKEMLLGSTATEVLQRSKLPVYLINIDLEWYDDNVENRKLILAESSKKSLSHVMHATDFSETANRALDVIKNLDGKGLVGKVTFVHVLGHHAIALSDPVSREALTEQSQQRLEELRNSLTEETRESAEIIVTFGTPAKEIVTTAENTGATMLVMGSQGKGFVEKFFLGGVSSQVTRVSNIPVLLIPAERK